MEILQERFEMNNPMSVFDKAVHYGSKDFDFHLHDLAIEEIHPIKAEKTVIELIKRDDRDQFVSRSKSVFRTSNKENNDPQLNRLIDRRIALKFLHIACRFDSVNCARALIEGENGPRLNVNEIKEFGRTVLHSAAEKHANRCIELLLSKQARTDLRTKDSNAQLALETALSSKRMIDWSPDETIEDLVVGLNKMDLSVVKMLAENTKDTAEVAYLSAMEGRVVWLAALLIVAPEEVTSSIMVLRHDGVLASKDTTTIYKCVLREAMSFCQEGLGRGRQLGLLSTGKRKLLLREIELLQLFGATPLQKGSADRKVVSPLIRAAQARDEEVTRLLLKTNIDVNETDGEGNSALHWYLKTSSHHKKPRIVRLLLKHGAIASLRNRMGLTPLHVAAANGNCQALQILLLQDPNVLDSLSELKETPLFFAVKNDFANCANLLLAYGANTQILNLRSQRAIDLAKSQDMQFLLSQANFHFRTQGLLIQGSPISWLTADQYDDSSDGEMSEAILKAKLDTPSPNSVGELSQGKILHPKLKQGLQMTRFPAKERRKIFIGGLPPSIDSDTLQEFFEDQFGPVEDAVIIGDQVGDQVRSRGFGFITFKNEESAAAAVQSHIISVLGAKVEIKEAVPKLIHTADRPDSPMSPFDRVIHGQKQRISSEESQIQLSDNISGDRNLPSWVLTFKKWFPGFLDDVSLRLKEGEWYPLSSLKGDFRATCGLEIDHASLGYRKLSDFMRSFPGICPMQVVPVSAHGRATHMVLLPKLPRSQQQRTSNECLKSLMKSFSNFCCISSGESASSNSVPQEKTAAKEEKSSESVDPRFLSFLKWDDNFCGRPWKGSQGSQRGPGDEENDEHNALESCNNKFSYFARQYDFYRKYENPRLKEKCFKLDGETNVPWISKQCDQISPLINKYRIDKIHTDTSLICDTKLHSSKILISDEDFPHWDPNVLRKPKKKKA